MIMKCLVWNCRGAGNPKFFRALSNYVNMYIPACIAILETKCSSDNANSLFTRIGYRNTCIHEGQGRSRGIWIGWRPNVINITGHSLHPNFINLKVLYNNIKWYLTIVYASPQPALRAQNWADLAAINPGDAMAWALIGDFNDIVDASEKRGGAPWESSRGRAFSNWIHDLNLIDVVAEGPKFTWFGPIIGSEMIGSFVMKLGGRFLEMLLLVCSLGTILIIIPCSFAWRAAAPDLGRGPLGLNLLGSHTKSFLSL